jgi:dTDP-4-dehydrorhamnose reductase
MVEVLSFTSLATFLGALLPPAHPAVGGWPCHGTRSFGHRTRIHGSEPAGVRILVLGATGMLGHKLVQRLSAGHEVVGTTRSATVPAALRGQRLISGVSAEDFSSITRALAAFRPEAVVNCIGLIKQLKPNRRDQIAINAMFPHQLLELCQAAGARLIHLSTDCVFSGRHGNYTESSPPDPVDDYGRSKLLGELEAGGLTLRTSIIGRELSGGHGLVEWFYRQRGQSTRGFRKAIYSGLTTLEMSRVIANVLEQHPTLEGVWHVSSAPINKCELLNKVNALADLKAVIEPQDDFVCDRSLDSARFERQTGYQSPSWDAMLEEMVRDGEVYDTAR